MNRLAVKALLAATVPFASEVPHLYDWTPATVIVCRR